MRTTALFVLAMLLVGCGPHKERFNVTVHNDTKDVLTIGFIKDSGPDQDIFMPPEFLAMDPNVDTSKVSWGFPLAPHGKPAKPNPDKPVVALLDHENDNVYLRIYRGELPLNDILAIGRGSPRRLDVVLTPGDSSYTITEKDGRLVANRTP